MKMLTDTKSKRLKTSTYLLLVLLLSSCSQQKSKVYTPAQFTEGIEGPAVHASGDLYLVNFKKQGTVGRIPAGKEKAELFLALPEGSIGNGIRFINDSVFYLADYKRHNIFKVNINSKEITTHAHSDLMHQPNDIAVAKNGNVYASDPNWNENTGQLWLVTPNGETKRLAKGMGTTNGIEVDPTEKILYVNESIQRKVWKFDIQEDGTVVNKVLFHEFADGGMDGMRCDQEGNLYIARYDKGMVVVLSPKGKQIRKVDLHGIKPTNLAFGGKDGKSVYVTMQGKKWVELFKANHPGRSFGWKMN